MYRVGKNSQLGKHGFGSLYSLTWICYQIGNILPRHCIHCIVFPSLRTIDCVSKVDLWIGDNKDGTFCVCVAFGTL